MTEDQYQYILKLVDNYQAIASANAIVYNAEGYLSRENNNKERDEHKLLRDYLQQFVEYN